MRSVIAWLFAVSLPTCCWGQNALNDWANLKRLQPGEKVEVVDMNLKSLKGKFVSLSEEAISLRTDDEEKAIERANVLRVSALGGKRRRNALIGLAIGAGAGLAVGAAIHAHLRETTGPDILAELAVPLGGAIGAGAGAGVGAAFPGSRTIYRAPERRAPGESQ